MLTETSHHEPVAHGTLLAYITADHERLDRLLEDVLRMVGDGELERAEHYFGELRVEFARHRLLEEQSLFPLFEELTGLTNGPTAVMRREHVAIDAALEAMASGLERQDATAFLIGALAEVLRGHDAKELRVIATVDEMLDPSRRAALLRRLVNR